MSKQDHSRPGVGAVTAPEVGVKNDADSYVLLKKPTQVYVAKAAGSHSKTFEGPSGLVKAQVFHQAALAWTKGSATMSLEGKTLPATAPGVSTNVGEAIRRINQYVSDGAVIDALLAARSHKSRGGLITGHSVTQYLTDLKDSLGRKSDKASKKARAFVDDFPLIVAGLFASMNLIPSLSITIHFDAGSNRVVDPRQMPAIAAVALFEPDLPQATKRDDDGKRMGSDVIRPKKATRHAQAWAEHLEVALDSMAVNIGLFLTVQRYGVVAAAHKPSTDYTSYARIPVIDMTGYVEISRLANIFYLADNLPPLQPSEGGRIASMLPNVAKYIKGLNAAGFAHIESISNYLQEIDVRRVLRAPQETAEGVAISPNLANLTHVLTIVTRVFATPDKALDLVKVSEQTGPLARWRFKRIYSSEESGALSQHLGRYVVATVSKAFTGALLNRLMDMQPGSRLLSTVQDIDLNLLAIARCDKISAPASGDGYGFTADLRRLMYTFTPDPSVPIDGLPVTGMAGSSLQTTDYRVVALAGVAERGSSPTPVNPSVTPELYTGVHFNSPGFVDADAGNIKVRVTGVKRSGPNAGTTETISSNVKLLTIADAASSAKMVASPGLVALAEEKAAVVSGMLTLVTGNEARLGPNILVGESGALVPFSESSKVDGKEPGDVIKELYGDSSATNQTIKEMIATNVTAHISGQIRDPLFTQLITKAASNADIAMPIAMSDAQLQQKATTYMDVAKNALAWHKSSYELVKLVFRYAGNERIKRSLAHYIMESTWDV